MKRRELLLLCTGACALAAVVPSCGKESPASTGAGPATLVQLADALDRAIVPETASERSTATERVWSFDEPRPEWKAFPEAGSGGADVSLEQLADGLRVALAAGDTPFGPPVGGIMVDLEDGPLDDWSGVVVRARSRDRLAGMGAIYNPDEEDAVPGGFFFFTAEEGSAPVFSDGSVQSYSLPLIARESHATLESLGIFFASLVGGTQTGALEILSVTLVPRGAGFDEERGVRAVTRDSVTRRTLYAHTPATLTWKLAVPAAGRLDLGLAVLPGDEITYVTRARAGSAEPLVLLDEEVDDAETWKQHSLDLSALAGQEIELTLEATSERPGATALWGAPILSGGGKAERPNVIFYVIDGGGADLMSLYGYERPTTPFLQELAQEGVVFEHAYSNSTWTQSSTASFMTGLQHSVLGGLRRGVHSTPVPVAAVTMAERMRAGGYQTASFTTNPNAARVIGLERGVDYMRDAEAENDSTSSRELHEIYWRFRETYPGSPTWVHFQTTDVHQPNEPVAPFAGRFVPDAERELAHEWEEKLFQTAGNLFGTTSIAIFYDQALERAGIDRHAFYDARRGLYDETMAFQDAELRNLVERLKAEGEWENTLLVIGADHGHPAGTFARFGRGLFEPRPPDWEGALFDSYSTRVPLMFVWPAKIEGGRRIAQPVSMIDVLPTIVELAGLPAPEITQGRSLAPLLLSRGTELEPKPVIFDEFRVEEPSGEMVGNLEIMDGRWGASLEIGPDGDDPARGRHPVPAGGRWGAVHPFFAGEPRLLLYDLEKDPFTLHAVNAEHPELVERYRKILLEHWAAHRALAQRFQEAEGEPLTTEQLQQLRALGYIR